MTTLYEEELPPPAAPGPPARRPSRLPKRFIETAASGSASKRAKPAQLVCALPASSSSWVSCDNCEKWRRVAHEPKADNWCCSDNLDAKHSTCGVPQEMTDAAIDSELGLAQEAAANVAGTLGVRRGAPPKQRGRCEHGRRRSQCKKCAGAGICQHGRQHSQCKGCGLWREQHLPARVAA